MNKRVFTYKKSGVDINAAEKFVKFITAISSKKKGKKKLNNIGGFGSISNIPNNIKDPKIVKGCKISECSLVGGETAEMPGTYEKGKFDIAGFAVGVVDKKKILNKKKIKNNDLILAVPSSGLHSNGYSLVRNIISKRKINIKKNSFLKNELIKPTKIYVKEVLNLIDKKFLNGCANITGGGLPDNIKRIIPERYCAEIDLNKIKPLKIFKWLKKNNIKENEMLKTFNCGVGFCLVINPKNLIKINKYFSKNYKPYVIGKISKKSKKIKLNGKINWS
jgi:phosphoribosylformylglycinamidine cyclo-ligase